MPLENATSIATLDPTLPAHDDLVGDSDAHLRLIKGVLKTTFPNLNAPVTLTSSTLNGLPSVIPSGVILMWSGSIASIPSGWTLCDGSKGTPDLRNRFVFGGGSAGDPGSTGGSAISSAVTATNGAHSHTGGTAAGGLHNHTGTVGAGGAHTPSGGTDIAGDHSHGGFVNPGSSGGNAAGSGGAGTIAHDGAHFHTVTLNPVGDHQHSIGFDGAHNHGISLDGDHAHAVAIATMPPFMVLAFIMKV